MDAVNEYLKRTLNTMNLCGIIMQNNRPIMKCADGFEISVQASSTHYCSPREDGDTTYDAVELGYPNREEPLIMDYAEDEGNYLHTVYGWVPIEIVNEMIKKHGGIIN